MKECVICHKPIRFPQRRYCSLECRRIAGILDRTLTPEQIATDNQKLHELRKRWEKTFTYLPARRAKKKEVWKLRIFVVAAIEICGFRENDVSKELNRDHSTIKHHLDQARFGEREVAKEFAHDSNYKFGGIPIYPPNFKYIDITIKGNNNENK